MPHMRPAHRRESKYGSNRVHVDCQVSQRTIEIANAGMQRQQHMPLPVQSSEQEGGISQQHGMTSLASQSAQRWTPGNGDKEDEEGVVPLSVQQLFLRYPGAPLHEEVTGCEVPPLPSNNKKITGNSSDEQILFHTVSGEFMASRREAYKNMTASPSVVDDSIGDIFPLPVVRKWERWMSAAMRVATQSIDTHLYPALASRQYSIDDELVHRIERLQLLTRMEGQIALGVAQILGLISATDSSIPIKVRALGAQRSTWIGRVCSGCEVSCTAANRGVNNSTMEQSDPLTQPPHPKLADDMGMMAQYLLPEEQQEMASLRDRTLPEHVFDSATYAVSTTDYDASSVNQQLVDVKNPQAGLYYRRRKKIVKEQSYILEQSARISHESCGLHRPTDDNDEGDNTAVLSPKSCQRRTDSCTNYGGAYTPQAASYPSSKLWAEATETFTHGSKLEFDPPNDEEEGKLAVCASGNIRRPPMTLMDNVHRRQRHEHPAVDSTANVEIELERDPLVDCDPVHPSDCQKHVIIKHLESISNGNPFPSIDNSSGMRMTGGRTISIAQIGPVMLQEVAARDAKKSNKAVQKRKDAIKTIKLAAEAQIAGRIDNKNAPPSNKKHDDELDIISAPQAVNGLLGLLAAEQYFHADNYLQSTVRQDAKEWATTTGSKHFTPGLLSTILRHNRAFDETQPSAAPDTVDPLFKAIRNAISPPSSHPQQPLDSPPPSSQPSSDHDARKVTSAVFNCLIWGVGSGQEESSKFWLPLREPSMNVLQEIKDLVVANHIQNIYMHHERNSLLRQASLTRLSFARKTRREFLSVDFYQRGIKSRQQENRMMGSNSAEADDFENHSIPAHKRFYRTSYESEGPSPLGSMGIASRSAEFSHSLAFRSLRMSGGVCSPSINTSTGRARSSYVNEELVRRVIKEMKLPTSITSLPPVSAYDHKLLMYIPVRDRKVLLFTQQFTAHQRDELIDTAVNQYKESLLGFHIRRHSDENDDQRKLDSNDFNDQLDKLAEELLEGCEVPTHNPRRTRRIFVNQSYEERTRFGAATSVGDQTAFSRHYYPRTILPGASWVRNGNTTQDPQLHPLVSTILNANSTTNTPTSALYDAIVSSQGNEIAFEFWKNEVESQHATWKKLKEIQDLNATLGMKRGREEDVKYPTWVRPFRIGFGTFGSYMEAKFSYHGSSNVSVSIVDSTRLRGVLAAWKTTPPEHTQQQGSNQPPAAPGSKRELSKLPSYYYQSERLGPDSHFPCSLGIRSTPKYSSYDVKPNSLVFRLNYLRSCISMKEHTPTNGSPHDNSVEATAQYPPIATTPEEKSDRTKFRMFKVAEVAYSALLPPTRTTSNTPYTTTFIVNEVDRDSSPKLLFYHPSSLGSSGTELLAFSSNLDSVPDIPSHYPRIPVDADNIAFRSLDMDASTYEEWQYTSHLKDFLDRDELENGDTCSEASTARSSSVTSNVSMSSRRSNQSLSSTTTQSLKNLPAPTRDQIKESFSKLIPVPPVMYFRDGINSLPGGDTCLVGSLIGLHNKHVMSSRLVLEGHQLDATNLLIRHLLTGLKHSAEAWEITPTGELLTLFNRLASQTDNIVLKDYLLYNEKHLTSQRYALTLVSNTGNPPAPCREDGGTHHNRPFSLGSSLTKSVMALYKSKLYKELLKKNQKMQNTVSKIKREIKGFLDAERDEEDTDINEVAAKLSCEKIEGLERDHEAEESSLVDDGIYLPESEVRNHYKMRQLCQLDRDQKHLSSSSVQLVDPASANMFVRQKFPLGNLSLRYFRCFAPRHTRYFLPAREHWEATFAMEQLKERRLATLVRQLVSTSREYCRLQELEIRHQHSNLGDDERSLCLFVEAIADPTYLLKVSSSSATVEPAVALSRSNAAPSTVDEDASDCTSDDESVCGDDATHAQRLLHTLLLDDNDCSALEKLKGTTYLDMSRSKNNYTMEQFNADVRNHTMILIANGIFEARRLEPKARRRALGNVSSATNMDLGLGASTLMANTIRNIEDKQRKIGGKHLLDKVQSFVTSSLISENILGLASAHEPFGMQQESFFLRKEALQSYLLQAANPFPQQKKTVVEPTVPSAPIGPTIGISATLRKKMFLLTAEIRRLVFPSRTSTMPHAAQVASNSRNILDEEIQVLSQRYLAAMIRRYMLQATTTTRNTSTDGSEMSEKPSYPVSNERSLDVDTSFYDGGNEANATMREWLETSNAGLEPNTGLEELHTTTQGIRNHSSDEIQSILQLLQDVDGEREAHEIQLLPAHTNPTPPPRSTMGTLAESQRSDRVLVDVIAKFHAIRNAFTQMISLHRRFIDYFGFSLVSDESSLIQLLTRAFENLVAYTCNCTLNSVICSDPTRNTQGELEWLKQCNIILIALLSRFPQTEAPNVILATTSTDVGVPLVATVLDGISSSGNEGLLEVLLQHWTYITTTWKGKPITSQCVNSRDFSDRAADIQLPQLRPILFPAPQLLSSLMVSHGGCSLSESEKLTKCSLQLI